MTQPGPTAHLSYEESVKNFLINRQSLINFKNTLLSDNCCWVTIQAMVPRMKVGMWRHERLAQPSYCNARLFVASRLGNSSSVRDCCHGLILVHAELTDTVLGFVPVLLVQLFQGFWSTGVMTHLLWHCRPVRCNGGVQRSTHIIQINLGTDQSFGLTISATSDIAFDTTKLQQGNDIDLILETNPKSYVPLLGSMWLTLFINNS